jgi:hypothetical protein
MHTQRSSQVRLVRQWSVHSSPMLLGPLSVWQECQLWSMPDNYFTVTVLAYGSSRYPFPLNHILCWLKSSAIHKKRDALSAASVTAVCARLCSHGSCSTAPALLYLSQH